MSKNVASLRSLCSSQSESLNTFLAALGAEASPLRKQFEDLKSYWNSLLDTLPPIEQVEGANQARWSLESLESSLETALRLIAELTTKQTTTITAALADAKKVDVEALLVDRVKAGDFVAKDVHTSLCSAAREAGRTEALEEARKKAERAQLIADRKVLLVTASLPVPGDDILALAEDQFTAVKTTATERHAKVVAGGVPAVKVPARMLYCSVAEFEDYHGMLTALAPQRGGDPMLGGDPANPKPPEATPAAHPVVF